MSADLGRWLPARGSGYSGSAGIDGRRAPRFRLYGIAIALIGIVGGAVAWMGLAPLNPELREEVHRIPKGTWARRSAGEDVEILPSTIHLTLELKDILVLINNDDVPQQFGPVLMMPGQSFRLPFGVASDYQFACTAHVSGYLTVQVDSAPPWWKLFATRFKTRVHSAAT